MVKIQIFDKPLNNNSFTYLIVSGLLIVVAQYKRQIWRHSYKMSIEKRYRGVTIAILFDLVVIYSVAKKVLYALLRAQIKFLSCFYNSIIFL